MTRSDAYGTIDKGAVGRELIWELPEGLWPVGRRAIEPPPPALWRCLGRPMRSFAPLPVPPRALGALPPPEAVPEWSAPVDSFFAPPRESGAWARGAGLACPPPRLLPIPIPPAPKVASAPPPVRDTRPSPPERPRLMLHAEDELDAGLAGERRLFGLPLRRSVRACGTMLLSATLIGMAIDWSPTDRAATATASHRAPSTALHGVLQASAGPKSPSVGVPATTRLDAASSGASQPARVGKRGSRHRARPPRAEPATVASDPDLAPQAPEPSVAPVGRTGTRAVLISSPRPRYPQLARKRGIGGTVVVGFAIDAHGRVRDAAIESSNPPGVFDRAALHAIENTRYRPRVEDGEAVMTPKARKRFTFHVRDRSGQ